MMQKRNLINRASTEALTIQPVDGLYNQPLFDCYAEDSILAFTLFGGYNKALDAIGFKNSDVYRYTRNFLTYVAPAGTAAGNPVTSDHADACAPGTSVEAGGCSYKLEGWGRMRKTSDTRDLTDIPIRYSAQTPTYDIAGNQIEDDLEWDMVRLTTVMLQDFQRRIINGNKAIAGQADGLLNLITYGYVDPVTGEECTSMDATVIDYNDNVFSSSEGATGVTFNGNAVADGYNFYDYVASWAMRIRQRINNSSLTGEATHIALIPSVHLNALVESWVCHVHCGGDLDQAMRSETVALLNGYKEQLYAGGSVTLTFNGIPVTFFPYDYGLLDVPEEGEPTTGTIIFLTTRVGNTKLIDIQVKDMRQVANLETGEEFITMDNGRFLSWNTVDHTCYRVNMEMQWRIDMPAPWAQMVIENVRADSIFGPLSTDPLSPYFTEQNLVKYPVANSSTFTTLTAPTAANQFHSVLLNTTLNVNAANGLLNGATGTPAPTATAVTSVATTAGGDITILSDGSFTYDPPSATFTGVDTYVFTVSNSQGSDTATLTIVVYEANA